MLMAGALADVAPRPPLPLGPLAEYSACMRGAACCSVIDKYVLDKHAQQAGNLNLPCASSHEQTEYSWRLAT